MRRIGAILIVVAAAGSASARPDARIGAVLARWDADPHPDLVGAIVLRDGAVIAERYFNGADPDTLHDIRSAGKSITALLVGIAIDRGRIAHVTDPVRLYWPEAAGSAIGEVVLADVLTMRSGLAAFDADSGSPGQEDRLDAAPDPLAFIRALPRADPPGTRYRYNSVTASVAGIVVARATGMTMERFAAAQLFAPLGITRWHWEADAAGYTKGQGNLSLRLRDFAAIGEMVRHGGVYRGHRVIGEAWLRQALAPQVAIGDADPYADGYGFFWYGKTQAIAGRAVRVAFASGNGGNKLYIVPDRHLVIAIQSRAYGHGYGQKRSEEMLRAILAAPAD